MIVNVIGTPTMNTVIARMTNFTILLIMEAFNIELDDDNQVRHHYGNLLPTINIKCLIDKNENSVKVLC